MIRKMLMAGIAWVSLSVFAQVSPSFFKCDSRGQVSTIQSPEDRMLAFVTDNTVKNKLEIYQFYSDSSDSVDGSTVLSSYTGLGRWKCVSSSTATGAALATGGTVVNETRTGISTGLDQEDYSITNATSSTAISISWTNKTHFVALGTNTTFTFLDVPTSSTYGREMYVTITNTGAFTAAWPATVNWKTGSTLPASRESEFRFKWDRTNILGFMNTAQRMQSVKLQYPRYIDGTGCVYANTNDYTANTFMIPRFSGTGATNANKARFAFRVPNDIDTSVDLQASLTIRLSGADTAAQSYHVGMVSIANSAGSPGTAANFAVLPISADASGASGDIESVSNVTLTGWRSNITAGNWLDIELRRDGANDASTVAADCLELEIFYASNQ